MSYQRVIPRDLFNEASLLKCCGQLYLKLEALPGGHRAELIQTSDRSFEIEQDEASGAIWLCTLELMVAGEPYILQRPLNSREPWPLYAENQLSEEETAVFTKDGELTPEFIAMVWGAF